MISTAEILTSLSSFHCHCFRNDDSSFSGKYILGVWVKHSIYALLKYRYLESRMKGNETEVKAWVLTNMMLLSLCITWRIWDPVLAFCCQKLGQSDKKGDGKRFYHTVVSNSITQYYAQFFLVNRVFSISIYCYYINETDIFSPSLNVRTLWWNLIIMIFMYTVCASVCLVAVRFPSIQTLFFTINSLAPPWNNHDMYR